MFAEAIEDILSNCCTPAVVRQIEHGDAGLALWSTFSSSGFLELLRGEDEGGAALPLNELFGIIVQFGRHAAPLPFAQSICARILVGPGTALPDGPLTLAPALLRDATGALHCPAVPYGTVADHVLAVDGERMVLIDARIAQRGISSAFGGQVTTLSWIDDRHMQTLDADVSAFEPMAATLHAALIAGALERVLELTLLYCIDRRQFGKLLGSFQVIQHQMSLMAEHVAAVRIAAEGAFEGGLQIPRLVTSAIAKARASEAAPLVANIAHAVHGAIGVTEEYDLQLYTRRLHEWRMAHGSESYWHAIVGQQLLASDQTFADFICGL